MKLSATNLVLAGSLVWLLATAILLLTQSVVLYCVAYAFFGIGAGLLMPGFMAGASLCVDASRQGAIAGLVAMVQGIGGIAAPVISTTFYEIEPSAPFLLIAAMMFILLGWFAGIAYRRQQPPQPMA